MDVQQFRYNADNLGYLVIAGREALAIDAGAVAPIQAFIQSNNLTLTGIANTHTHPDHTGGNSALAAKTGAPLYKMETLIKNRGIKLGGRQITIHHTPGHSPDSIIFDLGSALITGDTLFIGKMGRCFTGNWQAYFESARKLATFAAGTIFYPGHDYVHEYLDAIRRFEPDNPAVEPMLAQYEPGGVCSTLDLERRLNPHLRYDDPEVIQLLADRGVSADSSFERWRALMEMV